MGKRDVEAFGADTASTGKSLKSAATGAGKFGPQEGGGSGGVSGSAGSGLLNDEPKGGQKRSRPVRAWGYLPRASMGGLQQDHARGDRASRQNRETGEFMPDGGNSAGRTMQGVNPSIVDTFQGRSGQPDNQDTFRKKGST